MADIISLKLVRKRKARDAKDDIAMQNRAKFGRTKAEKNLADAKKSLDIKRIDAHKIIKPLD